MIGQTVSHYKILEKLGCGGMGVVYKAEDLRLKRIVALKFLPLELTKDLAAREQFIAEAQAASALDHPNICTIHEIDQTENGQLFISMSCYTGETLRTKIDRQPLPPLEIVDIVRQVAHGLSLAHQHGIVHRDISPSNIMIPEDGVVKILDFGLATLAGQAPDQEKGHTAGTLSYMSPEQVAGADVDHRTDIWSLGVLIFEMLTQQRPFRGDHAPAMMYSITAEEPSDLSALREDVPEELQELCRRCLQKEKAARPQSMHEVLDLLGGSAHPVATKTESHGRYLFSRAWVGVLAFVLCGVALAWFISRNGAAPAADSPRTNIGILKFSNGVREEGSASWPETIQALLVTYLTGVEGLAIFEPVSLNNMIQADAAGSGEGMKLFDLLNNADVTYALEGSILKTSGRYEIHAKMSKAASRQVMSAWQIALKVEEELPAAVDSLSRQLLDYLQESSLLSMKEAYLEPWWPRRFSSVAAVKSFNLGCQYAFKGDHEKSNKYLRQAIQLDSTFITPRVWLIGRLIARGDTLEAGRHYRRLMALYQGASPFEQAIIRWAGASYQKNLKDEELALSQALEYSPGNNILLYSLGRVRYLRADYNGVIALLKPTLKMKWRYSPLYHLLGQAYDWMARFDEAEEALKEGSNLENVYPETYSLLGTIMLRKHDTTKGREYDAKYIESMKERGYSLPAIYDRLATLSYIEALYENGSMYYRLSVTDKNEIPAEHLHRASEYLVTADTNLAIGEYFRTLVLDSTSRDAHKMLIKMFEARNNSVRAQYHYHALAKIDSTEAGR